MKDGKWLEPRYASKEIFEKDYPRLDLSGIEVMCPGCKGTVKLSRRNNSGKSGGWCKKCNRPVTV